MPETTPEPKGDKNRGGVLAGGRLGGLDPTYLFGTEEEVANRTDTGYPKDKNPTTHPPAFKQIPPVASSGSPLNDVTPGHKSGDIKFSGGI